MGKEISQAVIKRLPRYYRYLGDLLSENVERISSKELAERMHVTASQIRQDLNNFGGFGQQGYGYSVPFLYEEIGKILGLNETHNVIILGVGNLGQAIANYMKFDQLGFKIIGLFDSNPDKEGQQVRSIPIMHISKLKDFVANNQVDIAALTLPKSQALSAANQLKELGIHAIWNFAHVDLDDIEGLCVENVHLSDSLMQLSYNMSQSMYKK